MAYEDQADYIPGGKKAVYVKLVFRFLQTVFGIAIAGVYGTDIMTATKNGSSPSSAWLYATIVGALSAVTASIYCIPAFKAYTFFWFDLIIVILHSALVGIFGKAYLSSKIPQVGNSNQGIAVQGPDRKRMHDTAILDTVSGCLWLMTGAFGFLVALKVRRTHKKQSGSV